MTPTSSDVGYLGGLTVLYVEDEPAVQASTASFLRRRIARLRLAEDGLEGLEAYHQQRPDILVTDIMMPRMDGLSMIEAIRAEDPDLPIIVVTAFEQTKFLLRAIACQVDRYVLKPVDADQLEAALLVCARQLRAEAESRQRLRLERELAQARQHESLCILAQGMAHDYNNLLQAILSTVYAASAHTEPGTPIHRLLDTTERFSQVARSLGQQLLTLGEVNYPLDQEGSLNALVEELATTLPGDAGIVVETSLPEGLPAVRYNQDRLRQALDALLTNAVEAMPQGGTLGIVATRKEVDPDDTDLSLHPGTYLCLSFQDTGVGMDRDVQLRIFDPYFSTKQRGAQKGQGLGLAICRSILLAHGGQVTVASEPGLGSTFQVFLPAAP